MPNWIPLSSSQHATDRYRPREDFSFTKGQTLAPVLLGELKALLPQYAIALQRAGEEVKAVALLGLDGKRNLYLNSDSRWLASHVPATLSAWPFALKRLEDGRQVLCIEQGSLAGAGEGEALFDAEGNLGPGPDKALNFLNQCEASRQQTQAACRALDEAGVLEDWPLKVERGEGQEPLKIAGLLKIDEKALNALPAEGYAALRGGAMYLAQAQLLSMHQIQQLGKLAGFHARQQAAKVPQGLENLFSEDEDELNFDFGDD